MVCFGSTLTSYGNVVYIASRDSLSGLDSRIADGCRANGGAGNAWIARGVSQATGLPAEENCMFGNAYGKLNTDEQELPRQSVSIRKYHVTVLKRENKFRLASEYCMVNATIEQADKLI